MEESSSQKVVWGGEAKAMQQCLTDIFTSVYTTCDIPENAIFGPCVLSHTSLYDSIAFIALKSTDKRTAPYIFRVDTSAANGTSEGLMWLRLVQSSRDKEEQNLEAYVKNKQLFYRSLRRIEKDEELLVWYGKDLLELLLLSSSKAKVKGSPPYSCQDCNQRFQFEFPFLAHLRFRCTKRLQGSLSPDENVKEISDHLNHNLVRSSPKLGRSEVYSNSQEGKPTTDFHNLARDLENHRSSPKSDQEAEITSEGSNKRKFSELAESRNANLQRSLTSKEDSVCTPQQLRGGYIDLEKNRKIFSPTSSEPRESKRSAFTEVKKTSPDLKQSTKNLGPNTENKDSGRPSGSPINKLLNVRQVLTETQIHSRIDSSSLGSAFTSVPQQLCGSSERKSAFSQPSRSFSHLSPLVMTPKLLPTVDCHSSIGDSIPSSRLYQADNLAAKLQSSDLGSNCTVQSGIPKQSPFVYATAFWPKTSGPIQLQMPSSLTLLPPSFTSLCLPAQNWCAKCNASFRMTSDLVYHMRSHHKKEFAMEPLVKRRREEKLKCPICNESFRERHHLSRHMTSHN